VTSLYVWTDAVMSECVAALDAGGIVVLPTRRWYMLCADSTNGEACQRIFDGKGRSRAKPLALVVSSDDAVADRFTISAAARCLANGLWPGDLALSLPWREPASAHGRWWLGAETAMVTRDPWLLGAVAARTRNPPAASVVSVSDGRSEDERAPALSPAQVRRFVDRTATPVDVIVDGGVCPIGRGLTVVDCAAGDTPRLVREGAVHVRALREVLYASGFAMDPAMPAP
jgi:tRNA threonylcarbamoyl adenosine modification protein (Sua5/YciO/YrdC/YwlC family)